MKQKCLFILIFSPFAVYAQLASSILPDSINKSVTRRQVDLIDIGKSVFHIKPPKSVAPQNDQKVSFSFLPTASVPDGSGRALVTSTTAGMYLGPRKTTNLSSATFAPYWNFGSRFGLPLRNSIWFPNNALTIQGDVRILRYPQYTWGLGSSINAERTLVDYNYIRFYQSILRPIKPYLFAGLGYNLDLHSNIHSDEDNIDLKQFTNYAYGTANKSVSSGITFNLLYDTRNNTINPLPGAYANIIFRTNQTFLGSDYKWNSVFIDLRKYIPMNPSKPRQQNTLALWSFLWSSYGNVPYLDLPSIGWDPYNRSGRGIDQNRYRGKSMFYLESEYRRDITENGLFGFIVFGNITTVSGSGDLFTSWHPAAGAGLRIKASKVSGTNLGLDFGVSKGYGTVYLSLGETF